MRLKRHGMIASIALVIILLVSVTSPVWGQSPITRLRNVAIQVLSVTAGLTTDDLTTTDDAVIGDALTVTGDTVLSANLNLVPATEIVVTMNATITPLGTYQPLSSAGTVNTSSITAGDAGDLLILTNTETNSIVFTDTGTLKLSGNITLGQYDTLELISDGTNWIQLGTVNN